MLWALTLAQFSKVRKRNILLFNMSTNQNRPNVALCKDIFMICMQTTLSGDVSVQLKKSYTKPRFDCIIAVNCETV